MITPKGKIKIKKTKEGSISLKNKKGVPLIPYEKFVNETKLGFEHRMQTVTSYMLEISSYLDVRLKTAKNTYNITAIKVCKDIAKSNIGMMKFSYNTIYQYSRVHGFIQGIHDEHRSLYNNIVKSLNKGYTKFTHILSVCRGDVSDAEKIYILEQHVAHNKLYITTRALYHHAKSRADIVETTSANIWDEGSITVHMLNEHTPNDEKMYAPFGLETPHNRVILPSDNVQRLILSKGFIDEETMNPYEDDSIDNVFIQYPQFNIFIRGLDGSYRKNDSFNVSTYDEVIRQTRIISKEARRVTKLNGRISILAWNLAWNKKDSRNDDPDDFIHASRCIFGEKLKWVNSAVVLCSDGVRKWLPWQAYRIVHIFKKI